MIEKHTNSMSLITRNFSIKKMDEFNTTLDLLQEEASVQRCDALNTMGFLHFHGIGVMESKSLALEYFKSSASHDDPKANFVCFCIETNLQKKYGYLGHGLVHNYPKSFGTLGFLIDTEKISQLPQSIQQ